MNPPAIAPASGLATDAAGFALAVLLAVLLWARGPAARQANGWLATALVALVLTTLGHRSPGIAHLTGWLAFLFGPGLWLYTCRVTGVAGPRGQRLAAHFIPAAAMLLVLLPRGGADAALLARPRTGPDALYVLTAVHMLAYWLLGSLRLGRAGYAALRLRWWACMALWAVWIIIGAA